MTCQAAKCALALLLCHPCNRARQVLADVTMQVKDINALHTQPFARNVKIGLKFDRITLFGISNFSGDYQFVAQGLYQCPKDRFGATFGIKICSVKVVNACRT
jgi:hypothetical protein